MTPEISKYINSRYRRWLDYAKYHASMAGIPDQDNDVLHVVLVSLLDKNQDKINELFDKKSGQYTELDYYVLKMIKLNCHSMTSPYRHKYRAIPVDNRDPWDLEIEDSEYSPGSDRIATVLKERRLVRIALEWTFLSFEERRVCELYFLGDMRITEAAKKIGISYGQAREVRIQGIEKIRSTLDDIIQLRKN